MGLGGQGCLLAALQPPRRRGERERGDQGSGLCRAGSALIPLSFRARGLLWYLKYKQVEVTRANCQ